MIGAFISFFAVFPVSLPSAAQDTVAWADLEKAAVDVFEADHCAKINMRDQNTRALFLETENKRVQKLVRRLDAYVRGSASRAGEPAEVFRFRLWQQLLTYGSKEARSLSRQDCAIEVR
jgi:hypothetical protein